MTAVSLLLQVALLLQGSFRSAFLVVVVQHDGSVTTTTSHTTTTHSFQDVPTGVDKGEKLSSVVVF
jgi:hypothetical protein